MVNDSLQDPDAIESISELLKSMELQDRLLDNAKVAVTDYLQWLVLLHKKKTCGF